MLRFIGFDTDWDDSLFMLRLLLVDGSFLGLFLSLGTGGLEIGGLISCCLAGLFCSAATVKLFVFNDGFTSCL